jgi:hypothetical protein
MTVVAEIAERIAERRKLYAAAYQADVDRMAREHGEHAVREALRMIEQPAQQRADVIGIKSAMPDRCARATGACWRNGGSGPLSYFPMPTQGAGSRRAQPMSAFGGKADISLTPRECLLLTQSGHSVPRIVATQNDGRTPFRRS